MISLPREFEEKMERILGEEYKDFRGSFLLPRKFGLRVNRSKISAEKLKELSGFHLTPIPWIDNGFYYEECDRPSRHPFYYAGLYYLQEPSAMTPANVLPIEPGDRVLDLCAAPGGKTTELGAKLQGSGFLAANDISGPRCRALLKNVEVFGIPNSLLLNEVPAKIAGIFPEFFDKILVDAPCSGEGMFRKDPDAARVWNPAKPIECARMQREILTQAVRMLRPGGLLLYSTCTFSPEEDEQMAGWLLANHPELSLEEIPWYEGFDRGRPKLCLPPWIPGELGEIPIDDSRRGSLERCVRIWPHRMGGEGHFLAMFRKEETDSRKSGMDSTSGMGDSQDLGSYSQKPNEAAGDWQASDRGTRRSRKSKSAEIRKEPRRDRTAPKGHLIKEDRRILEEFLANFRREFPMNRIEVRKGQVYCVPKESADVKGMVFVRNGLYMGEIRKNRFEPSQALASCLKMEDYRQCIDLPPEDERIVRYLKGETIEVDGEEGKGWYLLCVSGFPLGWGRLNNGILKNKYLLSWRMN